MRATLSSHHALQAEDKIGVMLPCNVILLERANGEVEVATIDPTASMKRVGQPRRDRAEQAERCLGAALEGRNVSQNMKRRFLRRLQHRGRQKSLPIPYAEEDTREYQASAVLCGPPKTNGRKEKGPWVRIFGANRDSDASGRPRLAALGSLSNWWRLRRAAFHQPRKSPTPKVDRPRPNCSGRP